MNAKEFIFKDADKHASDICEKLFPLIKGALREAYAKGFMNASTLAISSQNKQKTNNQN